MVVFLDPLGDGLLGMAEALVLVDPDLLFFQAAVESFDEAVAFGMIVSGVAMLDAKPVEGFHVSRRG